MLAKGDAPMSQRCVPKLTHTLWDSGKPHLGLCNVTPEVCALNFPRGVGKACA